MTHSPTLQAAPAQVRHDIERAVEILKNGGCREVYVFGSVAEGRVASDSDIDLAVRGCPPERFYKLQGKLLMELRRSADLVDLDLDPELAAFLERESVLIHVG